MNAQEDATRQAMMFAAKLMERNNFMLYIRLENNKQELNLQVNDAELHISLRHGIECCYRELGRSNFRAFAITDIDYAMQWFKKHCLREIKE
jgi:hypothetical protein